MDLFCKSMLLVYVSMLVYHVHCKDPIVELIISEERAIGLELGSLGDDSVLSLGMSPEIRGSVRYSLLPQGFPKSSLFRVDEDSGQIFSKERIDREILCGFDTKCDLDIQVAVQSAISQFFKKVKVTVKVKDINDNAPTFTRPTMQLNMLESVPIGASFFLEEASDLDIGSFGVKDYELVPNFGAFQLNITRGSDYRYLVNLVVHQKLDRETAPVHTLILIARDGGLPSLSGSVSVVVSVNDVNDNAPVFDQELYNASLPETAEVGTKVASVIATDFDTAQYGIKEYRFSPQEREDVTKYFAINSSTGDITVTGSLLERQGETLRIQVECMDKGIPPLVSRTEVDITVEDTENTAPSINLNTMFGGSVSEMAQSVFFRYLPEDQKCLQLNGNDTGHLGAHDVQVTAIRSCSSDDRSRFALENRLISLYGTLRPRTVVALLGVIDRDAGLNGIVTCSIISDAFELQALTVNEYKVIVVRRLDREAEPVHEVSVLCQDAGTPSLSGTVKFNVKIKDENDNAPYFSERIYQKSVPENNSRGQILLRVTADDRDIGENGRISYNLIGTNDLKIDTRGNIIANISLDHEKTKQLKFQVVATDNGSEPRSTTVDIVVTVTDRNDESPLFEKDRYEFEVMENLPVNTTVNTVLAVDKDSGDNGMISYTILPKDNPFEIRHNGVIVTKDKLDREHREHYSLTIYAVDKGEPSLTGTTAVIITVGDQNDHVPRIIYPRSGNSSVVVAFETKPGSAVLRILTDDEDSGPNRELKYHLASDSGLSMFELQKDSGDLILIRSLTLQDAGRHRLTVVVTDQSPFSPLASNSSFDVIIVAPNETEASGRDKEKEHVKVVIILGAVTGIITVAVIITIIFIRRADVQQRKYIQNISKTVSQVHKLEAENVSVGYVISNSAQDGLNMKGDKDLGKDLARKLTDEGFLKNQ